MSQVYYNFIFILFILFTNCYLLFYFIFTFLFLFYCGRLVNHKIDFIISDFTSEITPFLSNYELLNLFCAIFWLIGLCIQCKSTVPVLSTMIKFIVFM